MIRPITQDEAWLASFHGLPAWQPPLSPAVVLAPHPDDETLGAGALIATLRSRGISVTVAAATDGENAYDTLPEQRLQLGRIREQEQRDALARLGVEASLIHRFRMTDSGLMMRAEELAERLRPLVDNETHLIAPWAGDFHPDHVACARAAASVQKATGCQLTSYFFWTWHRGTPADLDGLGVRRFVPDSGALLAKSEAIRCHASQLQDDGEDGPILPENLLGPVSWPLEVFLPTADRVTV